MWFVQSSGLRPSRSTGEIFVHAPSTKAPEPHLSIAKDASGTCVFRENRRCALHVHGGEAALPIGCRHYPRVVRRDTRGVALSLSHYCPTAAALLLCADPIHVVTAGEPLAVAEPIDGLDVRDALPPLLRPGMLTDLDGYATWEASVIGILSRASQPSTALATIAAATEHVRTWSSGRRPLSEAVAGAFQDAASRDHGAPLWTQTALEIVRSLNEGIVRLDRSDDLDARWSAVVPAEHTALNRIVCNYLAARAFANWIAYQGRGLRTIILWLHACFDVMRVLVCRAADERGSLAMAEDVIESARQADYVLLHTIDSQDFARMADPVEA